MGALSAAARVEEHPDPRPVGPGGYRGPSSAGVRGSRAYGEAPADQAGPVLPKPDRRPARQEPASEMYAIVKTGGKQYKVAVGDVVDVELLDGDSVDLQPVLSSTGPPSSPSADDLAKVSVTGEILGEAKGPKIKIHKYKNKTGYHKRIGHRQRYARSRSPASRRKGAIHHGSQEGCIQLPQRSRLELPAARGQALRRPARQRRRDPRSASAAPSSTRAPASAAAATTRCSRWPPATSSSAARVAARPSASCRSRSTVRPH